MVGRGEARAEGLICARLPVFVRGVNQAQRQWSTRLFSWFLDASNGLLGEDFKRSLHEIDERSSVWENSVNGG
jgi:hypothetical protein